LCDSEGEVNILGDDIIGHSEEKRIHINMCLILNGYLYTAV